MIDNTEQLYSAIDEIREKTNWSFRRIGEESAINYATISRIAGKKIEFSHDATRKKLYNLQMRVRGMAG